jgi:ribosome biogenesis protein NSA2
MPQHEHIEEAIRKYGRRLDHEERTRKRQARKVHLASKKAQSTRGLKAKILNRTRRVEKIEMRKKLNLLQKRAANGKPDQESDKPKPGALPTYLQGRNEQTRSKVLSNLVKEKRKEKAGKWTVPLPKVQGLAQDNVFRVIKTGKRQKKAWKRQVTKCTFVGEGFTRKPPKFERFIRPMALRMRKAHVTHPELRTTFQLPILGVKKNPQGHAYTELGVLTKGTIIEVNVSDLGLVTTGGKMVWGKYAQVTNHPENDGCVNALLLV